MIQITPHMKILLAVDPADFRKGIDGFAGLCKNVLKQDPFSGYLFVFINKARTSIKILTYDSQGMCLFQKRLSKGRFLWWPERDGNKIEMLSANEMQQLLWNGNIKKLQTAPIWRAIS